MATKLRANQINIQDVMNDPAAQATDLLNGTLRIATQAEVNGGSPYDNTIAITPATLAGATFNTNWVTANNGANFTNAPSVSATETNSIAIGDNASVYTGRFAAEDCIAIGTNAVAHELSNCIAIGTGADASLLSSVAIGTNAYAAKSLVIGHDSYGNNESIVFGTNNTSGGAGGYSTVVGNDNTSSTNLQMLFGKNIEVASTTTDVEYAVKIGYGTTDANKNMLHLFSKGKLELYGNEAQFIFPNYRTAGSPLTNPLPSTTNQGGTVYDDTDNVLKFYNGTGWMTVADGNWLHANNGSDFGTTPAGTGTDSIALGNNASTGAAYGAVAVGTNVTAAINAVSIGPNSDALGTSSVAIGSGAQASGSGTGVAVGFNSSATGSSSVAVGFGSSTVGQRSIALGNDSDTLLTNQIAIGYACKSTSVDVDTTYSVKLGEGDATANKNMLHLFSQGKLELYGAAAQFIMPNYVWGSPAVEPATATEGGLVYDSTAQGLKVYDGAAWQAVGGGSGVTNPLTADLDTGGWNIITAVEAVAGNSDALTIRTGNTTHAGTSQSGNLVLQTGHGFSDNDSGDITVATGGAVSGGGSGATGAIRMDTGDVQGTGSVGEINIRAGAALNGTGGAGSITITSGGATGSINAGTFNLRGGTAVDGAGGTIEIEAGEATGTGTGGDVDITGGVVNIHGANGEIAQSSVLLWDDTNTAHTTGNYVEITVPAGIGSPVPANWTLTLPPNNGTVGQVLQTDGSGVTSWVGAVTNPMSEDLDVNGHYIITADVSTAANPDWITIRSGSATYAGGGQSSGQVQIRGGSASNGNNGGRILFQPGPVTGSGNAGNFNVIGSGAVTGSATEITLTAGSVTGAGTPGAILLQAGGALGASGTGAKISLVSGTSTNGNGGDLELTAGSTGAATLGGDITITPGGGPTATSGNIDIHTGKNIAGQAAIRLWDDTNTSHTTGNHVEITVPAGIGSPTPTSWTLTLPPNDGTAGQVLQTDGAGVTTWETAGGVTNPLTADLDVDGFSIVGAVGGTPATISLPNSTDSAASFDITGRAFAGGGVSADINIIAGAATNANNAGDIFVTGGVNPIGTGDAGSATIAGGESNTTGDAGNATVIGGRKRAAADQAGNAILEGGPGQTAASAGDAIIKGGLTATTSGTPTHGNVIIRAHDYATNSIPDEGKVIIEPGRSAAAEGTIEFHSGTNGTGQASIQFWNDTDTGHTTGNYVAIAAPNPVGSPSPANWTLTLPPNDGTANQMLMTDGSGNTSWSTELKEFSETSNSYGTTGAQALDTSTGTYFYPTGATTGNITFSFTNPATSGRVTSFTLELWGGAGSPTPYTWPSSVKWPGGTEPTWTASGGSPLVNGYDVVGFVTRDGGTTWLGMLGGLAFT